MPGVAGEFDVVMQGSTALVDRVVATMHQNQDPAYPRFLHRFHTFVHDVPRTDGTDTVREADRTAVSGVVEGQISTLSVSLPTDPDANRIEIAADLRTRFTADPGSPAVAEYLHGTVRSRIDVELGSRDVGSVLNFALGAESLEASFEPVPDLAISAEERRRVDQVIRNFLRSDMEPVNILVRLPPEIHHVGFKTFVAGVQPAVGLLVNLRAAEPSATARDSVTENLMAPGTDFAVGINADFIRDLIRELLIAGAPAAIPFSGRLRFASFTGTATPDWAGARIDLNETSQTLAFAVDVPTHVDTHVLLFGDRSFDLSLVVSASFRLRAIGRTLLIEAAGMPEVGGIPRFFTGALRVRIAEAIDGMISVANAQLRERLDIGMQIGTILEGLTSRSTTIRFAADPHIRRDGIVARGTVAIGPSAPAVATYVSEPGPTGRRLNARRSWIPGGMITRFRWIPASGPPIVRVNEFVLDVPIRPDVGSGTWCLEVEGSRVTSVGAATETVVGRFCGHSFPTPLLIEPFDAAHSSDIRPVLALVEPSSDDGRAGTLIGHFDPWWSGLRPWNQVSMLVLFSSDVAASADLIRIVLAGREKTDASLLVLAVVADPTLPGTVGTFSQDERVAVRFTDDPLGRWANFLGVQEGSASFVVDPAGEVAWSSSDANAKEITNALDQHAAVGGDLSWQQLRLAVGVDDLAPDFVLRSGGAWLNVRKLRGRPITLLFWQWWSAPSISEMQRLGSRYERGIPDHHALVAVHQGGGIDDAVKAFEEARCSFPLVLDRDGEISRAFGVGCWPTTVTLNASMRVADVRFGAIAPPPLQREAPEG